MLKLALRNLTRRKTRTGLTVMGVAVAISFTVGILSVTEGFMVSFTGSMRRQGADIFIMPKQLGGFGMPGFGPVTATLPESILSRVKDDPNVESVYPAFGGILTSTVPFFQAVMVSGVEPRSLSEMKPYLKLSQGRMLQPQDRDALVVGSRVSETNGLRAGDVFEIEDARFKVVGVFAPTGGLDDGLCYTTLPVAQKVFERPGQVTHLFVKVKDTVQAPETARRLQHNLPRTSVQTVLEVLDRTIQLLWIARAIHLSMASIALLIGVLFVLSTMLMAVSERVKEIATLRAIGFGKGKVFRLILLESCAISVVGGLAGCIGGFILARVIEMGIGYAFHISYFRTLVTPRILAFGFSVAILIGSTSGLYPAWRIARTNIAEALHYE